MVSLQEFNKQIKYKKRRYLHTCCSDKVVKGTVVNWDERIQLFKWGYLKNMSFFAVSLFSMIMKLTRLKIKKLAKCWGVRM